MFVAQNTQQNENRWEERIQGFEEQDKANPPPRESILFVGSSSIVFWQTLAEDMAPLTVINRGFGGSQMHELNMYRDRIVTPYEPKAVLVYEGDNDVAAGRAVEDIVAEYRDFVDHLSAKLPNTNVYLIAVKPSIRRASMWQTMQEVNRGLQAIAVEHAHVTYLDIASPMLLEDGSIDPSLFVADELHMNAAGYQVWTKVIRPVLIEAYGDA